MIDADGRLARVPNLNGESIQVVIVGGGFGGIYAALQIEKLVADPRGMKVTLISRDNFFLFTPMLHEVSSGSIATRHITIPIRKLYHKCDFREGEVLSIDLGRRTLISAQGEGSGRRATQIGFTHLLLALGSVTNFFGMTDVERHSMTMKTIGDAIVLRNSVIDMLEQAELEPPVAQSRLLTFVVAGGGFAGVELVAELNDFVREAARNYKHVELDRIRVMLVDPGRRILPELSKELAEFALSKLRRRGVEVLLETRVLDASEEEVVFSGERRIAARTLIWTAGVTPDPIVATLPCDRDQRSRILTNQFLEVPGWRNVWAIGDCAAIPDLRSGKTYPPTAQHAIREGKVAAENIIASIMGGRKRSFDYSMKGQLASLGQRAGVANFYGVSFSGFWAWWLWRTIYLFKLPQFDRKVRVALDWTLDLLFPRDIVKLKTFAPRFSQANGNEVIGAMNQTADKTTEEGAGGRSDLSNIEAAAGKPAQVVHVPDDHSVSQPRRSFLGMMIALIGASITGALAFIFGGYSMFPLFKKTAKGPDWSDVAPIGEIPDDRPVKKAVVISQDWGWGRYNSQELVWILKSGDAVTVYSASCPHLGCTINSAEKGFICPCHGSAWNRDGRKIGGPTPRGMDTLESRVENGSLQVKYQFFREGTPKKEAIS